jgi:hypothetical protein
MAEKDFRDYTKTPCPRCGWLHDMEPQDMPWTDEFTEEFTCRSCDKPFEVEANVSVSWTAKTPEDEEEE